MSDLNLLKSWNPKLVKNKKKVWEAQQELMEENKRIKERQKEIEKEREFDHYASLSRDGKKVGNKKSGLEWMYDDPTTELKENEDYLLGRKEITSALIDMSSQSSDKQQNDKKVTKRVRKQYKGISDVLESKEVSVQSDLSSDDPMTKFKQAKQRKIQASLKPTIKKEHSSNFTTTAEYRSTPNKQYDGPSRYQGSAYNAKSYRR